MNFSKKTLINKTIIIFVSFVFVFQPAFVFAEDVDSLDGGSTAVEETQNNGEDGSSEKGDVYIETGDVSSDINFENNANQNLVSNDPKEETIEQDETFPGDIPEETSSEPQKETTTDESGENTEEEMAGEQEEQLADIIPEEISDETQDEPPLDVLKSATSGDDVIKNDNDFEGSNVLEGDGISGENTTEETDGTAIIDSGDIEIGVDLENDINKNDLDVFCVDCVGEEATSSEFDILNSNESNLENEINVTATSGDNYVEESKDAYIETGNIGIVSIIVNFINTNFIGNGKQFFVNIFNDLNGNLDLSGYGEEPGEENSYGGCDGPDCQFNIENHSTSTLENKINIDASTGANVIATTTGGGTIKTGDIDIVDDILNIANLNISGSEWFFAVVNIFGEMEGDVILPAFKVASSSEVATGTEEAIVKPEISSDFIISNQNNASLDNNFNSNLNTGDNNIESGSSTLILSGDIVKETKILNLINYNIAGDYWKFARINVFGSWQGIINGLPDEYSYYEDESGITIYNQFLDDPKLNEAYAQLAVDNYNIASTTNEINIEASTGDNSILHSDEPGIIETGYIKIKNSLMNFLNSNFSGNNWEFSMLNVFGEWKGNLDFGQPELWINSSVSEKETAEEGDYVTYSFIYGNNGDTAAKDVIVVDDFNEGALEIAEVAGGEESDGLVSWSLGDLPPNSQGSFSYTTRVRDVSPGNHVVDNVSTISSGQSDRDESNNSSSVSFDVNGGAIRGGVVAVSSSKTSLPSLSIVKTNDASDVSSPGDIIDYKLVVKNNGSKDALEVYVLDVMKNIDTEIEIHRDFWDLGTVLAGEEIIIEYSLEITEDIESGTYINEATIEGYDPDREMYISAIGSSKNKIINNEVKEILKPNLTMSRVSRSSFVNPGTRADYEIIIANNGRADATDVEIDEILPENITYSGTKENVGSWKYDVIESGAIENIKYSVDIATEAKAGFYKSYLSLVGANIDNGFLADPVEIREVEVLGVAKEDSFVEKEQENTGTVLFVKDEPIYPPITLGGGDKKIENINPKERVTGQILGVSENEDSVSRPNFYRIYLFVVLSLVLLILILFIFFMEGKEDREKLM